MSFDFTDFSIWCENAGDKVRPPYLATGFGCGDANPEHFNWWFNRTDDALHSLDNRLSIAEANITVLSETVNNFNFEVERSGLLGYYVFDSTSLKSIHRVNSPGVSSAVTVVQATHTVQAEGNVFISAGFEANIQTFPHQGKNCVGIVHLLVNDQVVITSVYGSARYGTTGNASVYFGQQRVHRLLNAEYSAYQGNNPFDTFSKGQTLNIKLSAFINATYSGTLHFGIPKLYIKEHRAVPV